MIRRAGIMTLPPLPQMDKLPNDILDIICRRLNQVDREALVHLALATPTLFAPAISAAIRYRPSRGPLPAPSQSVTFDAQLLVDPTNDTFGLLDRFARLSSDEYRVGMFARVALSDTRCGGMASDGDEEDDEFAGMGSDPDAAFVDARSGHPRWMLLLPPRNRQRRHIAVPASALWPRRIEPSARWSLLRIPVHQLQFYTLAVNTTQRIPPLCRALCCLGGPQINIWAATPFPDTIRSLELRRVKFPFAFLFLDQILPPQLERLYISLPLYDADWNNATLLQLLRNLPATIREFVLDLSGYGSLWPECSIILAEVLPSLDHLELCSVKTRWLPLTCSVTFASALQACAKLKRLAMQVNIEYKEDYLKCVQIAAALPTGLDALQFDVIVDDSMPIYESEFAGPLPPLPLPRVARELQVTMPDWVTTVATVTPIVSQQPGLVRLVLKGRHLGAGPESVPLLSVLPASLKSLTLEAWDLHGTGVLDVLARHYPPHLQSLIVKNCTVHAEDLTLLASRWPSSLVHLGLPESGGLTTLPLPLPPKLQTLDLSWAPLGTGNDEVKWVTALPTTLQRLHLGSTTLALVSTDLLLKAIGASGRDNRISLSAENVWWGDEVDEDWEMTLKGTVVGGTETLMKAAFQLLGRFLRE
ncbi:hypothetical protein AMAG_13416 [Allomyces macrogynus ATCC 38327]|uniref:Uncharacterized protein n=1 Tax=Allomyces macrogynus (strain ATCC 38327) TaxID=578462 RepID=A0A0L0T290_ALLM3|nr:hypothetical protein AMAG_13416 [Allomyces macrogynus ATCC 38327]|eukprot:KNE68775.1 hypothetical protein AMAG_13416 [Allomyces macrogynus ATCC 38327]